jgi:hypothetical protein
MPHDQETLWAQQRADSWHAFCRAAESATEGDSKVAWDYAAAHPHCVEELRRFVKAIRAGTLVKQAPGKYKYYPPVKSGKSGVATTGRK